MTTNLSDKEMHKRNYNNKECGVYQETHYFFNEKAFAFIFIAFEVEIGSNLKNNGIIVPILLLDDILKK